MSRPQKLYFQWSDGQTHDATLSETSSVIDFCENFNWAVSPNPSGLTANTPDYTIEVSNDGITWFDYNALSTNVAIADAVDDIHLAWTKMRIKYNANTETTGTVEFLFTIKK